MAQRQSILDYHRTTAHVRGTITGKALNWDDKPRPFKLYRAVPTLLLGHDIVMPDIRLDAALAPRSLPENINMPLLLAGLCNLAAGITLIRNQTDGKVFHFRSMPSAGALYPTELYLAVHRVRDMNDGLYHYCPMQHRLNQLRTGRVFSSPPTSGPAIRFFLTSMPQRSAWKYGARAYRYCLLDAGHMAENLLMAARIHGLPAVLDYDFNDGAANRFLALDPEQEGCVAQLHAVGCGPDVGMNEATPATSTALPEFSRPARANPPEELLAAHRITSSFARCPACPPEIHPGTGIPLPDPVVPASTADTILRRRSRRNFVPRPVKPRVTEYLLGLLCRDLPPVCADALQVGFLAGKTSGFPPGYYHLDRTRKSITPVLSGNLLPLAAHVCLDQGWLENCALHVVFTADLKGLEERCGPRAYRYAHLEAGRLGEHVYLAATALNLGACGIGAFFDQEAATLLHLPEGHALLYLVGIGPIRK